MFSNDRRDRLNRLQSGETAPFPVIFPAAAADPLAWAHALLASAGEGGADGDPVEGATTAPNGTAPAVMAWWEPEFVSRDEDDDVDWWR